MEVAEDFFGPEIDAAFSGIAVSEFDDGDTLRPEEEKKRDDPEPDGDAAIGGDRRDYVEIEDGNYEQENEIAASEGADQVGLSGGLGGSGQSCFETPRFALADSPFDCAQRKLRRLSRHLSWWCMQGGQECPPHTSKSSARLILAGQRVPAALSPTTRQCHQRLIDAYRCRPRCAGRKSSIARPTNRAVPSRRG